MRWNRKYSRCCGGGGGLKSAIPELSLKIGMKRISEAEETGVDYLVTSCPFCLLNLRDAAKMLESKIEVYDILEIIAQVV